MVEEGKKVFSNSIFNFISVVINRGGGLIFTIILARFLNSELFGLYNLALSIILIALTVGNFGIDEALTRYVSANYEKGKVKARAYFNYLFKLKSKILISIAFLLILLAKPLSIFYNTQSLFYPLIIASIYLIFISLSQFFSSLFYTFQKVDIYIIKETIFQVFRIILLPLITLLAVSFWVGGVFVVLLISAFITLIFSLIIIYKKYHFLFVKPESDRLNKKEFSQHEKTELFNYLKFLTFGSLTAIFFLYIDVLILGKFVNLKYIGFYRAASAIVYSVVGLLTLVPVLYPVFSRNKKEKLNLIFNKLFYYSSIVTIPATFGLIFIAKPLIKAIYGASYLEASIPLYALSLLIFLSGTGDLFITVLNAQGKAKYTANAMFSATILNIILNFIFIIYFLKFGEVYAILGAAIATIISKYFNLSLTSHFSKKLEIKINKRLLFKPIFATVIMILFLLVFNQLTQEKLNLLLVSIEILLAALIYFLALYIIKGFTKHDVNYIINIAKQTRNIKVK